MTHHREHNLLELNYDLRTHLLLLRWPPWAGKHQIDHEGTPGSANPLRHFLQKRQTPN